MADIFSKEKRSWIMSRVKGRDTKPEQTVRSAVHILGFRFRKRKYDLPGNPDIVLVKYKTTIFVHGCFWHQHKKCRGYRIPKSNKPYWKNKLAANVKRDERNKRKLRRLGWKTIVVWECQTKPFPNLLKLLNKKLTKK